MTRRRCQIGTFWKYDGSHDFCDKYTMRMRSHMNTSDLYEAGGTKKLDGAPQNSK